MALLAYLIQKRQAVSRIELATLFWPDKPESNGRNNLSGELRQLTSLLPDCFTATYQTIQFTPPADMAVDSWIVEKSVRRRLTWPTLLPLALDYLQQERPEEEVSPMKEVVSWARMGGVDELKQSAAYYGGEFLEGVALNNCDEFDGWLQQERSYWQQNMIMLWQTLAAYYAVDGDAKLGLMYAQNCLEIEPWREELHQLVMLVLARLKSCLPRLKMSRFVSDLLIYCCKGWGHRSILLCR